MRKPLLLLFSLLAFGYMFQVCGNLKTYAETPDEEKDAINAFTRKRDTRTISKSNFEADGYKTDTTKNEYVAFPNGVYMQIVDKNTVIDKPENDSAKSNNTVTVRFVEYDTKANNAVCFNAMLPGFENYPNYYTYPDVFRHVDNGTSVAGVLIEGSMYAKYGTADIPPGWLPALKYVTNYTHVRMIIFPKMGYQSADQYANPYFYDIRKPQKASNQNY